MHKKDALVKIQGKGSVEVAFFHLRREWSGGRQNSGVIEGSISGLAVWL